MGIAARRRAVVVEQDKENPVPKKILAQAIVDISAAVKRLAASGLNRKAIVVLLSHDSGQPQYVIENVLSSLEQLSRDYTTLRLP